jgi:hypothetical protein
MFGFLDLLTTLTVSELQSVRWINDEVERISENPGVGEMYGFTPPPHSVAHDRLHLISLHFPALGFKMD